MFFAPNVGQTLVDNLKKVSFEIYGVAWVGGN
jgi:hypothetical protein